MSRSKFAAGVAERRSSFTPFALDCCGQYGQHHAALQRASPRTFCPPTRSACTLLNRDAAAGNHSCTANREWGDAALWSFSLRRGWRRHRDLPLPLLHASGCTVKLGQGERLFRTAAMDQQFLTDAL